MLRGGVARSRVWLDRSLCRVPEVCRARREYVLCACERGRAAGFVRQLGFSPARTDSKALSRAGALRRGATLCEEAHEPLDLDAKQLTRRPLDALSPERAAERKRISAANTPLVVRPVRAPHTRHGVRRDVLQHHFDYMPGRVTGSAHRASEERGGARASRQGALATSASVCARATRQQRPLRARRLMHELEHHSSARVLRGWELPPSWPRSCMNARAGFPRRSLAARARARESI